LEQRRNFTAFPFDRFYAVGLSPLVDAGQDNKPRREMQRKK
jgi:hypothetical protein